MEAANCTTVPVRKSNCGQWRFWYMVPAVIDSSANTHSSTLSTVRPTRLIFAYTTRATPSKPKNRPSHWRGRTDSPISGAAQAVSTGCMPTIRADRPAGMPSLIAHQTPAR
ncbi:hypothetical protein D3C72_2216780 [compost metagenome]